MNSELNSELKRAISVLKDAKHITAFTGAGISVESGIPPFRGETGLWSRYPSSVLDLDQFFENPVAAWKVIKEIFYDFFGQAKPNPAHEALALLEAQHTLKATITQNIDGLHQEAGSTNVIEFHGTSKYLVCMGQGCERRYLAETADLTQLPPTCSECGGVLKPDFIFFQEAIPVAASLESEFETRAADVFLVIGTTGEVVPASFLPPQAKRNGAVIIEVNVEPSAYTHGLTDIFLQGKAGEILPELVKGVLR